MTDETVLNPVIGIGDPVQLKISVKESTELDGSVLPEGWMIATDKKLTKGENFMTIATTRSTSPGEYEINIKTKNGDSTKASVTVVLAL